MDIKYIGMDLHKESISIAVVNSAGKLVMELVHGLVSRFADAIDRRRVQIGRCY
jgi:hypothetical protein